ncbi:MAG: (d)CMP kinase [Bacillota bacterium]
MPPKVSIAIDGPAGAGKSTVAKGVARALGYKYVDTGAMYRALTLLAIEKNIDLNNTLALGELAKNTKIDIIDNSEKRVTVLLNGVDVTDSIRSPLVTKSVSDVAKVPEVRSVLVEAQKNMALDGGVVMEGRDIGTVVLPHARYKFFIVASPLERAKRRAKDLVNLGFQVDIEKLAEDIQKRDYIDSNREVNPLKPAEDARIIDCTNMTAQQVVDMLVRTVTEDLS